MEHDLGVVIDRTAPGEVIEPQPGNTDNDTTPKAARPAAVRKNASPPQFAIPAQRENSSRSRPFPMTVPAPRRTLLHKKSAPFVVSEASRDRRSSHDISMEYLRSQGFTQPGPSSVTSTSSQQVYRKSAPPGSAQLSGVLSAEAGGW
ncbi:hypothetical protein CC80DRAFT_66939 [Byssothecium circinans]|uniref:Uncharacterized protein n=1 Tax=Byssothecium circinans TaxID=147558 RepID=A0A6A5TXN0_9PLEO|nr:hypothetical protein CC80DRAFT_66939 [Byssothecium circinans]